jgi:putative ABC transport system ATP-binding protein
MKKACNTAGFFHEEGHISCKSHGFGNASEDEETIIYIHFRDQIDLRFGDAMNAKFQEAEDKPLIELENLSMVYEEGSVERAVLDGVTETFHEGEIIILLGRSGSGKSTLLNLLGAIEIPTSGAVRVQGRHLERMSDRKRSLFRRKNVGFIFQFFNLVPTLTVMENLLLPLELNGTAESGIEREAHALLEEVGLADRRHSFPDRLSGGEQQRVAIARALIHDPPIVLADEPTGNLDYETGGKVIDLLDRLVRQRNKTLIMATHSRDLIGMADRIFTLRGGKLNPVRSEART